MVSRLGKAEEDSGVIRDSYRDEAGVSPRMPGLCLRSSRVLPLELALLALLALAGCDKGEAPGSASGASAPEETNDEPVAKKAQPGEPSDRDDDPDESGVTERTEAPEAADALSSAFERTAAAIRPSVVRIDVEMRAPSPVARGPQGGMDDLRERFFGPGGMQEVPPEARQGSGSGFMLDEPAGHVITNSHVIHGATRVTIVNSEGKRFPATVVGDDPLTDVGLVRFEQPPTELVTARVGDSDALKVGQWVLAVGSPLGLAQTVTAGIVSGLGKTSGRMRLSGERVRQYIQTDALINPGNSGGPLVNLQGEVIGINTLINVGPGGSYGFAIPINEAKRVARTLATEGRVRYPYIGVLVTDVQELPEEVRGQLGKDAPERGAFISSVAPGGPAARAGLQPGDIVTKLGGEPVEGSGTLIDRVSAQEIGEKVELEYVRGGASRKATIDIAELPGASAAANQGKIGIALQTLDAELAQALGVDPETRGAVVAQVQPGSPAERAGLAEGDIIVQVDGSAVKSAEEAASLLKESPGKPHLLRIVGPRGPRFVTVKGDS